LTNNKQHESTSLKTNSPPIITKTTSPIFSTPAQTGSGYKRFKSFHHNSSYPGSSSSNIRHTSNYYNQNKISYQPPPYQNPHLPHYSQINGIQQQIGAPPGGPYFTAARPPQQFLPYTNPQMTNYQTNAQQIYGNPNNFYQSNGYSSQPPQILQHIHQRPQFNQIYQQQHVQYPPNYAHQQLIQTVKSEPNIPSEILSKSVSQLSTTPYFTNPIQFKQEPNEVNTPKTSFPPGNSQSTSEKEEDSNAISIVNHLLKDKQILNQLEKVARSFQQPAGYQGTWNFKT
jgi:hypothetical protein